NAQMNGLEGGVGLEGDAHAFEDEHAGSAELGGNRPTGVGDGSGGVRVKGDLADLLGLTLDVQRKPDVNGEPVRLGQGESGKAALQIAERGDRIFIDTQDA